MPSANGTRCTTCAVAEVSWPAPHRPAAHCRCPLSIPDQEDGNLRAALDWALSLPTVGPSRHRPGPASALRLCTAVGGVLGVRAATSGPSSECGSIALSRGLTTTVIYRAAPAVCYPSCCSQLRCGDLDAAFDDATFSVEVLRGLEDSYRARTRRSAHLQTCSRVAEMSKRRDTCTTRASRSLDSSGRNISCIVLSPPWRCSSIFVTATTRRASHCCEKPS